MAQKTLAEEIITIIKAHSNDNPAPTTGTITRTYEDGNYADVETTDGTHRYIPVIGNNAVDTDGVIVYLDGDLNTPLMITAGSGGGTGVDIVTEWEPTPTDTKVPSEKLVKTDLDKKIAKSNTVGLVKNDGTIDTTSYSTFSGDYDDLTDKPTIPSKISDLTNDSDFIEKSSTSGLVKNDGTIDTTSYSTFSGNYNDLNGKPSLATVATTGDYDDLTDTPTIPTDLSDLTDSTGVIPTDVSDLTDTQNTPFTPKTHTHNYNDLNNKPELYNKQYILNIINATAKDHATTNNHTDLFANMTPITRNPTSSHFQLTRASSAGNTSLDDYPIGTNGLGITIELLNITHISYLRVSLTGDTSTTRAVTPTTPCTVRFECRPTNTKIYFDDELVLNETENNITSARFQVRTSANTTDEFDYRNLIIYPL